ncbi:unnamed protein product, partial [Ixodes hexagonus]
TGLAAGDSGGCAADERATAMAAPPFTSRLRPPMPWTTLDAGDRSSVSPGSMLPPVAVALGDPVGLRRSERAVVPLWWRARGAAARSVAASRHDGTSGRRANNTASQGVQRGSAADTCTLSGSRTAARSANVHGAAGPKQSAGSTVEALGPRPTRAGPSSGTRARDWPTAGPRCQRGTGPTAGFFGALFIRASRSAASPTGPRGTSGVGRRSAGRACTIPGLVRSRLAPCAWSLSLAGCARAPGRLPLCAHGTPSDDARRDARRAISGKAPQRPSAGLAGARPPTA